MTQSLEAKIIGRGLTVKNVSELEMCLLIVIQCFHTYCSHCRLLLLPTLNNFDIKNTLPRSIYRSINDQSKKKTNSDQEKTDPLKYIACTFREGEIKHK